MISYIIWDVDPRIFSELEFLRWYGVCWLVGLFLAHRIMTYFYKLESIPEAELDKFSTYAVLGILIGARLGHILFYDPVHYWNNPIEILPIRTDPTFQFTGLAGLASHGGVAGALLTFYLYKRKFKRDFLWILDRIAIASAPLFGSIRIGNLMNSEINGGPSNLSWAFIFERVDYIPRHPTQIYEALSYLVSGLLLFVLLKSKRYSQPNGFIFGLGATLMGSQRFLIEFLKENQVAFEGGMILNMGQILSIPLIATGIFVMVWSHRSLQTGHKSNDKSE